MELTVVVWMVTHNHEAYIEQAVESVMMQQTNFNYKLFIGEDYSTDNTRAVCLALKNKYPKRIQLFLHKENIGATANGIYMYEQCFKTGARYVALLEGDDYWKDDLKLQKQVDFLESKESASICFHNATVVDDNNSIVSNSLLKNIPENGYSVEQILKGYVIPTSTVMFRNCLPSLPSNFNKVFNGDTFLFCLLAQYGNAQFSQNIENSIRRIHGSGMWASLDEYERLKNGINTFIKLSEVLEAQYKPVVAKLAYSRLSELLKMHLANGNYFIFIKDLFRKCFLKLKHNI